MEIPSMKIDSKKEAYESSKPVLSLGGEGPEYPSGLCLYIDHETLEKLNFKNLPSVGEKFHLKGFAMVKSVSMNKSENGSEDKNVSFQITNLAMHTIEEESMERSLYGEADKARVIE
jgi:hypothetical protein